MYCSSCGMGVAEGLSYCKHCGAKLSGAKSDNVAKSSEVNPTLLVISMVALFVFGLLATGILVRVMKDVAGFNLPILAAVTIFSLLLLVTVESVFMRLLLKGKSSVKDVGDARPAKDQKTQELVEGQARALPEPVPSVTEHTTRAFEPIYSERKSE